MSADNWMVCPACRLRENGSRVAKQRRVADLYGKITSDEWIKLRDSVNQEPELETQENFREDYEQGMTEHGEYYVRYNGQCTVCEFGYTYRFDKQILTKDSNIGLKL